MKKLAIVLGIISILGFILLYNVMYLGYFSITHVHKDIVYTSIHLSTAIAFFLLAGKETSFTLYWYIYSAIAEFWAFLGLNMLLSIWIYYPSMYHIVIISLGAILLLNIAIAIKPVRNTINNYITQLLNAFKRWFC